ncbi:MAG: DegV family protein [Legionellaceae bacterium]|nr:DegV family protein [Legionellaceae bacterium]
MTIDIIKKAISAEKLLEAFVAAATHVIALREAINATNFFPVADKDTGENLSFSFQEIHNIYLEEPSPYIVLKTVSQSVFEHARGNSGLIFSMWLIGLESFQTQDKNWTLATLQALFSQGANYLVQEMDTIKPGTMVSFIVNFTHAFQTITTLPEIESLLSNCLEETRKDNTVSKTHNVVDAGALAVQLFLSHFFECLWSEKKLPQRSVESIEHIMPQALHSEEHFQTEPNYRYCTQAYLELSPPNMSDKILKIQAELHRFGDCSLFTQRENQLHFHVHTNEPAALFNQLYPYARVRKPKVEDMLRQYQATTTQKSIALVTDSSADIDARFMEKYHIHLLPISVNFDKQEGLEPYTIDKPDFYEKLEQYKPYPKTASPQLKKAKALLMFLSSHYDEVLVMTISSKMSGTYNALQTVSKSLKKVTIFDTLTNSGAHGLIVMKAAELAEQKQPKHTLLKSLAAYRAQVSIFVALSTTAAMRASGRVVGSKASLLKWLSPKLLLTTSRHGSGKIASMLFFKKDIYAHLLRQVIKRYKKKPFSRYCILYVSDKKAAETFAARLAEAIQLKPVYIGIVSSAVGVHAGKSALSIAFD